MKPLHISAAAGQPSTFWQGASGNWYAKKALARTDNPAFAVNPDEYRIAKSFWHRNQRAIIAVSAIVGCLLAIYIAYHFKKQLFKVPNLPKIAV